MSTKVDKQDNTNYDNNTLTDGIGSNDVDSAQQNTVTGAKKSVKKARVPKKGHDSWKPDEYNEDAFGPQNIFHFELTDPNYGLYLFEDVAKARAERISWRPVTWKELKHYNRLGMNYGVPIDSTVTVRGMTLMKATKVEIEREKRRIEANIKDPRASLNEFKDKVKQNPGVGLIEGDAVLNLRPVKMDRNFQMVAE